MRKVISVIGILAIVAASLLSSCATKEDIDGLQGQLDELKSDRIASIESQIKSISGSITKLESVDTELKGYITTLQTKQQELFQKDADLAKTISDLKVEVYGKISDEKTAILLQLSNDKQELLSKIASAETRLSQLEGKASSLESKDADLQKQIDEVKSELSSLKTKYDNLSKQLSDLESTLRSEISAAQAEVLSQLDSYKETIEGELLSMSSSIGSLQAKDVELEGKISELKGYVDTQIGDTKDWVKVTFATLEQYESVCGEVASVKVQIQTINSSITSLSKTVSDNKTELLNLYNSLKTQVGTDIQNAVESCDQAIASAKTELTTAYTQAIATAISTLETSMKGWVNNQLTGYYTIAQMDAKLKVLSDVDASMQSSITKLESDLNAAKTELTEAYTKAITDAINTYNGEITAQIAADIKTATDALQKQIDNLQAQIDALSDRVSALEEQIQSVIIIPAYSDGSVMAYSNGVLNLKCVVSPASALKGLTKENFKIYATSVLTKTAAFSAVNVDVVFINQSSGSVEIRADMNPCLTQLRNVESLSVAVNVKSGTGDYTSPFVVVTVAQDVDPLEDYVDLGLSVKWATCNVGASRPEDYGDYYQWAGTEDVSDKRIFLDWDSCPYHTGSSSSTGWIKYVPSDNSSYWSSTGVPDNKTVLDPEDDVAHVRWGGNWRMPTDSEWTELRENCSWTWTSIKDISGYKVQSKKSGYTDKWIFLPAAGFRNDDYFAYLGSYGYFWSSSLYIDSPHDAYVVYFSLEQPVRRHHLSRNIGRSVRPVYADCNHVLEYIPGLSPSLDKSGWRDAYRCKECGFYYEDEAGTILIGGLAEYESWKAEGGKGYLLPLGSHEYVDLGLSVKWATCNVGASKPEDCGGYYQWADTKDVTDNSIYLDWSNCPYHNAGSDAYTGWTKYVPSRNGSCWAGDGSPDNKTVLDPSDDVASVEWKGTWRMPTDSEWFELIYNCTWTWTSLRGMNGYKVQSTKSGFTDNWIFLPAAGFRTIDILDRVGSWGYYWSSSLYLSPFDAYRVEFNSSNFHTDPNYRYYGHSVRPVCK